MSPAGRPRPDRLADLALAAALAGRGRILPSLGRPTGVAAKTSPSDPVSDADREAEAAVRRHILTARPGDGFLGEEGSELPSGTGLRWVVDALDGTVNYLYGIPHCAVSVACERYEDGRWRAVAAAVADVVRGEVFTAARGLGARLDGDPVSVNDPIALADALVATEFAYSSASRGRQAATASLVLPRARDIRSTGSSALDLCWTAAGRFDGYYEDELSRWDWAAGALILREAGGTLSSLGSGVVAAGPALHRVLQPLVAPAGPAGSR